MDTGTYIQLILVFGTLSLLSFGGGNTVIPAIHNEAVNINGWMTDPQFAAVYAISQTAPGPSMLIVSLVGWKAAGIPGALIATAAMFIPSCLLVWFVSSGFEKAKKTPWRDALEIGLPPVALGLIFASGIIVARASDHGIVAFLITGITTILLVKTKINPLLIVGVAGIIGLAGFV